MKTQISIGHWGCSRLIRLLALILALAVASPVLLAQKSDTLNGRDKHDPTGAWLIRTSLTTPTGNQLIQLAVFNSGGTCTQDIQGESGFDPGAVVDPNSTLNIITSPQSGVWQKTPSTGSNTFAATLLAMEYQNIVPPAPAFPSTPLFRFDKVQYTGKLNQSGDGMELSALLTFFDEQGNRIDAEGKPSTDFVVKFNANGVRIPLTGNSLPIPPIPPAPN
jgi:hypothetical protein